MHGHRFRSLLYEFYPYPMVYASGMERYVCSLAAIKAAIHKETMYMGAEYEKNLKVLVIVGANSSAAWKEP